MNKEVVFAKTLQELKNSAKEQGGILGKEQVLTAFQKIDFDLDDTQKQLVFEYLKENKIGVDEELDLDSYLTQEEVDYLEEYLHEITEIGTVTAGQKEAITLSAMAGDSDAQGRLIEIYLPYVVEIAKLYAGQGVFLEDLIGEGNVALTIGSSLVGCQEHAAEVEGFLGKMIMDTMENYITENAEESKKDKKLAEKVNKISDLARELAEDLGRKVTCEELAQEHQIPLNSILEAIRLSGNRIEDIEAEEYKIKEQEDNEV